MQAPQRTSQTSPEDSLRLIKRGSAEIAQHWLRAVSADTAIPSPEGLPKPLLLDAVPLVLDEILRVIELDDSKIEHERICSAARHGRERAREHVDVGELVREYQLLRENVFLYLNKHVARFAGNDGRDTTSLYHRVGLALDVAVRETVKAFVEEHMLQLRHLSSTDSLTGLYNHRTFYERLGDELKRAERYEIPLSIVLVDLDNFKEVNDTKGHQFGDHLLSKCAGWFKDELRQTDTVCRYGGDEFGIILPETTRADARLMMVRLANAFRKFGPQEGAPTSFGMSFGLASHPEDDGTVMRMVKVADERLLLNKQRHMESLLHQESLGRPGQ